MIDGDSSGSGIHPSILERINLSAGECERRHERTNKALCDVRATVVKHEQLLIGVCGPDGRNGRLRRIEKDLDGVAQLSRRNEIAVAKGNVIVGVIVGVIAALGSWALNFLGG